MKHILILLAILVIPAASIEVQVSPTMSLQQAVDQVRKSRKTHSKEPAVIHLPKGISEIGLPIVLDSRDHNLTIIGSGTTLIGAPSVTGWRPYQGQIMKADMAKFLPENFIPKQLLFDGDRQILARYPNFVPDDPLYSGWAFVEASEPSGAPSKGMFHVKAKDLRKWAHPEDVEVDIHAGPDYGNSIKTVASIDTQTRLLTTSDNTSGAEIIASNRYFFQNALEELDMPGEWYYDKRTGILYFWPPKPLKEHEVRVPALESFFILNPGANKITISGLTLKGCHGTAIAMTGAEDCKVENCTINSVGSYHGCGVSVNDGHDVHISRNEISYTGSGGLFMTGGNRQTLASSGHVAEDNHIHHTGIYNKYSSGIDMGGVNVVVAHNHIHDCPRMGVLMWGNNHIVEYNHLHHLCMETNDGGAIYTGGRDWTGGRGDIWRYNLIHDVSGCSQEHEEVKSPALTFGLYPDDNAGGINLIGNIVYRIGHTPLHMHNARDCLVENNVLALGSKCQFDFQGWPPSSDMWKNHFPTMIKGYESVAKEPAWRKMRGMDLNPNDAVRDDGTIMSGNVLRHNIMFCSAAPGEHYASVGNATPKWNTVDYNLAWNNGRSIVTGINKIEPKKDNSGNSRGGHERTVTQKADEWRAWQSHGWDTHSIVADPLFVDWKHDDWRLKPQSPAFKLGFNVIPVEKIGIRP